MIRKQKIVDDKEQNNIGLTDATLIFPPNRIPTLLNTKILLCSLANVYMYTNYNTTFKCSWLAVWQCIISKFDRTLQQHSNFTTEKNGNETFFSLIVSFHWNRYAQFIGEGSHNNNTTAAANKTTAVGRLGEALLVFHYSWNNYPLV